MNFDFASLGLLASRCWLLLSDHSEMIDASVFCFRLRIVSTAGLWEVRKNDPPNKGTASVLLSDRCEWFPTVTKCHFHQSEQDQWQRYEHWPMESFDTGLVAVLAADLEKLAEKLGTPEDSEPLREQQWVPSSLLDWTRCHSLQPSSAKWDEGADAADERCFARAKQYARLHRSRSGSISLFSSDMASLTFLSATQENLDGQPAQTILHHVEALSGSATHRRPQRERKSRSCSSDLLASARYVGFAPGGRFRSHIHSWWTATASSVADGTGSRHASIERASRTTSRTRSNEWFSPLVDPIERLRRTSSKWIDYSTRWRNLSMNKAIPSVRIDPLPPLRSMDEVRKEKSLSRYHFKSCERGGSNNDSGYSTYDPSQSRSGILSLLLLILNTKEKYVHWLTCSLLCSSRSDL